MLSSAIDLKKLRAFYLVAKHGNLRNAAARLLLSTSAISIQINQLESELGVKLFNRVGRKLVLEPQGQTFYEHVHGILRSVDDAVESVTSTKPSRQRISLAVGTDLTRYFAPAIGQFMKLHPEVDIALQLKHSPESLARILEGELDMVVGYFSRIPKEVTKLTLMKSGFSMSFATSHPVAKIKSPTIRDMAGHHIISLRQQTDIGQRICRAFDEEGVEPPNYLEVGNCQSSHELAAQGIGIAVSHTTCMTGYLSPQMRTIDATAILGNVDVAVVHQKSTSLSPLHLELLRMMSSVSTNLSQAAKKRGQRAVG
jgi:DNA-binding transcriptional LysR family regulator